MRSACALDVTDRPGFTALLDEVERGSGPIDVIVNNAGIMPVGPLSRTSDERSITRQLEINLHAVIHGTQEAMRRMRPRGTRPHRQRRLDRRQQRRPAPRDLLRHQARRGRALRGHARRAARHRRRGLGRDAGLVSTELTAGTKRYRGVKRQTPEEVADAIVAALKFPRFDVYVPASLGPTTGRRAPAPPGPGRRGARCCKSDEVDVDRRPRGARRLRGAGRGERAGRRGDRGGRGGGGDDRAVA